MKVPRRADFARPRQRRTSLLCVIAFLLLGVGMSGAQENGKIEVPYHMHRFDDDFSYLADPQRGNDRWDPLKYISLGGAAGFYLTLSGELRERFDRFSNPLFGLRGPGDQNDVLQRLLLGLDLHLGAHLRLFAQFGSEVEAGKGLRRVSPYDVDRGDLQQGFVEFDQPLAARRDAGLRVGRQELAFGAQRLVSVGEPPNVRRSFDGVLAFYRDGEMRIDAFATRPVQITRGYFDDQPDRDQAFWGVYATVPVSAVTGLHADAYYLGLNRDHAGFNAGVATEQRHTLGGRLWGKAGAWDYDSEGVFQFGTFGQRAIVAWAAGIEIGYTFDHLPLRPRLAFKPSVASGDSGKGHGSFGTFNPLFPKFGYFSDADLVVPSNFFDLYPVAEFHLTPNVTLTAGADFLWRESTGDALYTVPLVPLVRARSGGGRSTGAEATAELAWQISRHLSLFGAYVHFFAGDTITRAGGHSVDYGDLRIAYKF